MNYYAKAIELISGSKGGLDYEAICIEIAKGHPAVFVKACVTDKGLNSECQRLVNAGQKIQAIKLWRNFNGSSLREAKDAIDNMEGQSDEY